MDPLCYKITAVLTAVTPLHIGSGQRIGVIKRSFGHVPGSALRGAIGTSIIKSVCKLDRPLIKHEECKYFDECTYVSLFGEEFGKASNVFFRYAYPLHLKCGGFYMPAPKTLYVCKNPQCGKTYDGILPPRNCDCSEDIEPFSGFQCEKCHEISEHPVSFSRTTSTALDRSNVSAAKVGDSHGKETHGTLHTTETIRKGSKFAIEVLVSKDAADQVDALKAMLERGLEDEGIGGGKSRGLGKVKVEDLKINDVAEDAVQKRAAAIDVSSFSVRLVSPMLLDGHMLDDRSLLEGCRRGYTWLFHKGKPKLQDIELKATRAESETFGGWSLKTEKRRTIEPAISAGSVFQFESKTNDETLALSLAALEFHAIGSYKPHGCGQVRIEGSR
jgi:CRISPR/Cas system CSM-associated protein Csm3 (group 7 of RAMP superfamily)